MAISPSERFGGQKDKKKLKKKRKEKDCFKQLPS